MAVLPSRNSEQEISKSDIYRTIFLPKIRLKADPNLLFWGPNQTCSINLILTLSKSTFIWKYSVRGIFEYIFATGCLILLATPKLPYVPESRNKTESWTGHPLKWLGPGLATPNKWQSPGLATSQNSRVPNSGEFMAGKFWTLPFFGVASPGLSNFRVWPVQDSVFFLWSGT